MPDLPPKPGDLEVPASGILPLSLFRGRVGDEPLGPEVSDAPIEVPWIDARKALFPDLDLLHDGVPVGRFLHEYQENPEFEWMQRKKTARSRYGGRHGRSCSLPWVRFDAVKMTVVAYLDEPQPSKVAETFGPEGWGSSELELESRKTADQNPSRGETRKDPSTVS